MNRNEKGFSLVELLVTMVVFLVVIAASSRVFTALLNQFKQQSKIAETNIEGVVGLDILRRDIAQAGFGLPYDLNGATYQQEAVNDNGTNGKDGTAWDDTLLNDVPNPPAAFRSINGWDGVNHNAGIHDSTTGSIIPNTVADVLAVKATNIAMNSASQKWSYIANVWTSTVIKQWGTGDALKSGDFITVIAPGNNQRVLQLNGSAFYMTFGNTIAITTIPNYMAYIMYGLGDTLPSMPFNRADYYVKRPATGMPGRCAPFTGILYKATINQSTGLHTELPLLDCVADFQVSFALDTDNDGRVDKISDDISGLNAQDIRAQVKEVHVFIVAQEGQKDINYDFSNGDVIQGLSTLEVSDTVSRTLSFVNLKTLFSGYSDPNEYKHYRWKLYTLIVKPRL